MEKSNLEAEKLVHVQKEICFHLTRITDLQELLREEEEKLYSCFQKERILKIILLP